MSDATDFWMSQIARYPLLPRDETLKLGRIITRAREADQLNSRVCRRAVHRLVLHNLRLVVHMWKIGFSVMVPSNDARLPDMLQEGVVGLHRAAQLFNPGLGYQFSTYAPMWIRKGFSDFLRTQDRTIRMSSSGMQALQTARKMLRLQPDVSLEDVAKRCRVTVESMRLYLERDVTTLTMSLDMTIPGTRGEKGSTLIEQIASPEPDQEATWCDIRNARLFDRLADAAGFSEPERILVLRRVQGATLGELQQELNGALGEPVTFKVINRCQKRLRQAAAGLTAPSSLSVA